jgi:TrmH family RNA methyltransferase
MASSLDLSVDAFLKSIRIVMVHGKEGANIGAAARALKTMGLTQLYLVSPPDLNTHETYAVAVGAEDLLESAVLCSTLHDAVADCNVVFGTSARLRTFKTPLLTPRDIELPVKNAVESHQKIAFVFGRETNGLTNEELDVCHYHIQIPTNPDFPFLNLGAVIQVIAYELRGCALRWMSNSTRDTQLKEGATLSDIQGVVDHLEKTLLRLGFLNPKAPKHLMTRLKRLTMRAQLDRSEVNLVRGICSSVDHALDHTDAQKTE